MKNLNKELDESIQEMQKLKEELQEAIRDLDKTKEISLRQLMIQLADIKTYLKEYSYPSSIRNEVYNKLSDVQHLLIEKRIWR